MADDSDTLPTGPLVFIQSVIRDKAIDNSRISVTLAVPKGQNYTGLIYRVAVTGEKDGRDVTLKYIVKAASSDEPSRGALPVASMYKREALYYTELLPIYKRMQEEAGIPTEDQFKFAECLHAHNDYSYEFIVFEDLKESGYFPVDRTAEADYDHARCALAAFGKLHAMSFVLQKRQPEKFKYFAEKFTEILFDGSEWFSDLNRSIFKKAGTVVEDEKHKEILKRYQNNVVDLAKDTLRVDEFSVLSHSDCWSTNMLFRYENEKPVDLCLLDYQIARYGPPGADVLHYIFSSTGHKLRREHYEDLLLTYHNAMKNHLTAFGYNIDEVYPWKRFKEELSTLGIYGLIWGICVPLVAMSAGDLIPDASDFSDFDNSALSKTDATADYRERIIGVMEDFITYGYVK